MGRVHHSWTGSHINCHAKRLQYFLSTGALLEGCLGMKGNTIVTPDCHWMPSASLLARFTCAEMTPFTDELMLRYVVPGFTTVTSISSCAGFPGPLWAIADIASALYSPLRK